MYLSQCPCSLDFRMPLQLKKGLQFNSSFSGSQPKLSIEASGGDMRLSFRLGSLHYCSFSLKFSFMSIISNHRNCLSSSLFKILQNLEQSF